MESDQYNVKSKLYFLQKIKEKVKKIIGKTSKKKEMQSTLKPIL